MNICISWLLYHEISSETKLLRIYMKTEDDFKLFLHVRIEIRASKKEKLCIIVNIRSKQRTHVAVFYLKTGLGLQVFVNCLFQTKDKVDNDPLRVALSARGLCEKPHSTPQ